MMRNKFCLILMFTAAGLLFAACSSLKTPPIQKKYFDLAIKDRPAILHQTAVSDGKTIMIKTFSIAPEFDALSFIYKVEKNRYSNDFYNEFVSSPTQIITEKIAEILYTTQQFSPYLAQNKNQVNYRLFGKITQIFFDLTQSQPHATLEIRFTLEQNKKNGFEAVFAKTYSETQKVSYDEPEQMADAMSTALTRISNEFIKDIKAL